MKYYTARGDDGTTRLFSCPKGVRLSKDDAVFDTLGVLDELNSVVGLCRAIVSRASFCHASGEDRRALQDGLRAIQEDLFLIQAELAGGPLHISEKSARSLEKLIEEFAGKFPVIRSFVIPGATELSARLDIARTTARRAERVYLHYAKVHKIRSFAGAYLNRLSSVLYCFARFVNYAQGEEEHAPGYGLTRT